MRMLIAVAALLVLVAPLAARAQDDGLITKESQYDVAETLDRLEQAARDNDLTVFARIDHAEGAEGVGLELPPTALLIFGSPRVGTPLMQSARSIGIDLPLKVLAWEDDEGRTHIAYNSPAYLAERHGITDRDEILQRMDTALDNLTNAATGAAE